MIQLIKKINPFKRENAQTMVEFALVFPIILIITYGIMEVGRAVFIKAAVNSSAREGARYGSATAIVSTPIRQYADCPGIRAAVRKTAFLIVVPDANITITYDKGPGLGQVAASCEALAALVNAGTDPIKLGDRVVVRVTAHYSPVIEFVGIKGFDILSQDARTIITKVKIDK